MRRVIPVVVLAASAFLVRAQVGSPDDARIVVDRTHRDLRHAEEFERSRGKEITRYENAERHLSDFDREITRRHFDKGKLDIAIDDLKNVVEHNTLDPEARDALQEDLRDLRLIRADQPRR